MAGTRRSSRTASAPRKPVESSSSEDILKKKGKNAAGRGRRADDDRVINFTTDDSKNNTSPEEDDRNISNIASSEKDNAATKDNNIISSKSSEDLPSTNKKSTDREDESSKLPPPQPSKQEPAKIKGRFMEVKMRQLTSYFSSRTSSYVGGEKKDSPPSNGTVHTSHGDSGKESDDHYVSANKNSEWKKLPLQNGVESDDADENNLKKMRINDIAYNDDGGILSDDQNDNNSVVENAYTTKDPDFALQPIDSKTEENTNGGGESLTLSSSENTATASCPLHLLVNTILSTPEVEITSTKDDKSGQEDMTPDPTNTVEAPHAGEDKKDVDEASFEMASTSIEALPDREGGDSSIAQCVDTKPTNDIERGDVEQTSADEAAAASTEQTANEVQSPSTDDGPISQMIKEGESSTPSLNESSTPSLNDVEMKFSTQLSAKITPNQVDANSSANEDVVMESSTVTELTAQHVEESTDAVMTDSNIHQVSVSTAASPPNPESSPLSNEVDLNTTKATLNTNHLKMALFLEASQVHAGNKPERAFANYWDTLAKFIALRSHSSTLSDPSYIFNTTLDSFLKTRKMKRLHNKLILALISDSLKDEMSAQNDSIPRVWQNRTRYLQRDELDDGVESNENICDKWDAVFGKKSDAWTACGNSVSIAPTVCHDKFEATKLEEETVKDVSDEIFPSCRLPGVLGTDMFVKKAANDAGLTVSHDAMWLLIVSAREYASKIIGKAIDNDKNTTNGKTSRVPKTEYTSLACEHLREKKGSKKKDSKKNDPTAKTADNGTLLNDSTRKRKILTSADVSQVLHEQHTAAPRLAWMRSLGRGVARHRPELQTTNDIINSSIQRAAIKRRRIADREKVNANTAINDTPVAVFEEAVNNVAAPVDKTLNLLEREAAIEQKGEATEEKVPPSTKINDSSTKAPPKSSDLLKSNVSLKETTTDSSATPKQSEPTPNSESTATNSPAPAKVSQIRQPSRYGAKNLAAMRARKRKSESSEKEGTESKSAPPQSQTDGSGVNSQSQQPTPAAFQASMNDAASLNKNEGEEKLARYQQTVGLTNIPLPQQPVTFPAPAHTSISKQNTSMMQAPYWIHQVVPPISTDTPQLLPGRELKEEEEEALPQPKLVRNSNPI